MDGSSPPNDSHIHPSLCFLTPSQTVNTDDSGEDDELPPAGEVRRSGEIGMSPQTAAQASPGPMFVMDLTLFSQYIKANMELSGESTLKLDAFCSPHTLEECLAIMYTTTLNNQDMLCAMCKTVSKTWEISGELMNKIWSYVWVFLLSPNLSCYCGNIVESALAVMKEKRFLMSPESGINLDDDEIFWLNIDNTLETYHSSGEAQMTQSLNTCYQADKQKYGKPLGDGHQTMSLKNVASWIKLINKNSQAVVKGVATAGVSWKWH
ncbi:hypothetical protein EDD18DRAFT_1107479 [Armillaria luteobubalina]|uniref:Uncharacterized protein n=1 Tax=Armillaria luteobubalina TaxID=153913 RepID=A0AA39TLH2_9AGAR|nr:hypothetical protein EDD18DRAFT_1107479 [Armillaria luteobubalina]